MKKGNVGIQYSIKIGVVHKKSGIFQKQRLQDDENNV
jgi:hypothetical protein